MKDALVKLLHTEEVQVYVPASVLAELEALGEVGKAALKVAAALPRLPDAPPPQAHESAAEASPAKTTHAAAAPAAGIVHLTRDGNAEHYMVATQDQRLRAKLRRTGVVPTLYLNQNALVMEPPPTGMASTETGSTPGAVPKTAAAAAAAEEAAAGQEQGKAVGGRKRRAAGPNPLSVRRAKKPRGAPAANAAGSKRTRRRTKRAAGSTEAGSDQ